jgi:hypothetical protein
MGMANIYQLIPRFPNRRNNPTSIDKIMPGHTPSFQEEKKLNLSALQLVDKLGR